MATESGALGGAQEDDSAASERASDSDFVSPSPVTTSLATLQHSASFHSINQNSGSTSQSAIASSAVSSEVHTSAPWDGKPQAEASEYDDAPRHKWVHTASSISPSYHMQPPTRLYPSYASSAYPSSLASLHGRQRSPVPRGIDSPRPACTPPHSVNVDSMPSRKSSDSAPLRTTIMAHRAARHVDVHSAPLCSAPRCIASLPPLPQWPELQSCPASTTAGSNGDVQPGATLPEALDKTGLLPMSTPVTSAPDSTETLAHSSVASSTAQQLIEGTYAVAREAPKSSVKKSGAKASMHALGPLSVRGWCAVHMAALALAAMVALLASAAVLLMAFAALLATVTGMWEQSFGGTAVDVAVNVRSS
jgi:hypothetical protein